MVNKKWINKSIKDNKEWMKDGRMEGWMGVRWC
jgi:hypothetical protein